MDMHSQIFYEAWVKVREKSILTNGKKGSVPKYFSFTTTFDLRKLLGLNDILDLDSTQA